MEHLGSTFGAFHVFSTGATKRLTLANLGAQSRPWKFGPLALLAARNELRAGLALILIRGINIVRARALTSWNSWLEPPIVSSALSALASLFVQSCNFIITAFAPILITRQTVVQVIATGLALADSVHHEPDCAGCAPVLITSGAVCALRASQTLFLF